MSTGQHTAHPYVWRQDGVCGGSPVIRETRFPVSSVAIQYKRGLSAEDILRDFPQLTAAQVYGALAYYFDHQPEIEAEIEQIRAEEKRLSEDPVHRLAIRHETRPLPGS